MLLKLETIYKIVKWHQVTHIFFLRIYKRVNGWVKLELLLFFFLLCYFSIFLQFLISIFIMLKDIYLVWDRTFVLFYYITHNFFQGKKRTFMTKYFWYIFMTLRSIILANYFPTAVFLPPPPPSPLTPLGTEGNHLGPILLTSLTLIIY